MKDLWRRIQQWLGLRKFVIPTHVEDIPDILEQNRLYLVGSIASPWSAAMLCPCGCRELIQISLILEDDPRWSLTYDVVGSASLHPSIWRIKGCHSHFFVRSNEIIWAKAASPNNLPPRNITSRHSLDRRL